MRSTKMKRGKHLLASLSGQHFNYLKTIRGSNENEIKTTQFRMMLCELWFCKLHLHIPHNQLQYIQFTIVFFPRFIQMSNALVVM